MVFWKCLLLETTFTDPHLINDAANKPPHMPELEWMTSGFEPWFHTNHETMYRLSAVSKYVGKFIPH